MTRQTTKTLRAIFCLTFLLNSGAAYAELGFRSLTCDAKGLKKLPRFFFIGEVHNDPASISTRDFLIEKAAARIFPVATEVSSTLVGLGGYTPSLKPYFDIYYRSSTDMLHGIESEIPYGLATSYLRTLDSIDAEKDLEKIREVAYYLVHAAPVNGLVHAAFHSIKNQNISKELKTLMGRLLPLVQGYYGDKHFYFDAINVLGSADQEILSELIFAHHKAVIEIVNGKYLSSFGGRSFFAITSNFDIWLHLITGQHDRALLTYRDRDFAFNLADLACHYEGKQKTVFIIVGKNHLNGMIRWFKQLMPSTVEILRYDSDTQSEIILKHAAELEKKLK